MILSTTILRVIIRYHIDKFIIRSGTCRIRSHVALIIWLVWNRHKLSLLSRIDLRRVVLILTFVNVNLFEVVVWVTTKKRRSCLEIPYFSIKIILRYLQVRSEVDYHSIIVLALRINWVVVGNFLLFVVLRIIRVVGLVFFTNSVFGSNILLWKIVVFEMRVIWVFVEWIWRFW